MHIHELHGNLSGQFKCKGMLQYSIIFVPKFLQKYTTDHNINHFIMGITWVFIQSINYRGQEIQCMGGSRISRVGHMYKGVGGWLS